MNGLIYVALGGALGASGRHMLGGLAVRTFGAGYPYGTLGVNVLGGFLMGLLVGWLMLRGANDGLRLFLGVGVLGGFTTFSAFSLDAMRMIENKAYATALGYISASVALSILALFIGLLIARKVFAL